MRLFSLGSGSSGNAFLLTTDNASILIDCGVAVRACRSALKELGAHASLAAVVVSHEHSDHIRSIPSILRHTDVPIVATRGTYREMRSDRSYVEKASGQRLADAGVEITFVGVSHDAAEPCGFVVEAESTRIAVFTDLGYVSEPVLDAMRDTDIIVLESNFDAQMLRHGPYPAYLKRRIQSPVGHLSNDDCATALVGVVSERTRSVWLAHLSHNNNHPDIARATTREALALAGLDTPVGVLPRYDTVEITALPPRQMTLGF